MSPPPGDDRERQPRTATALQGQAVSTTTDALIVGRRPLTFQQARERTPWIGTCAVRAARLRCEPLPDGRLSPDDRLPVLDVRTLAFGLTVEQLDAERRRLLALGWSRGEVAYTLGEAVA